jgi:hypothetical protein
MRLRIIDTVEIMSRLFIKRDSIMEITWIARMQGTDILAIEFENLLILEVWRRASEYMAGRFVPFF